MGTLVYQGTTGSDGKYSINSVVAETTRWPLKTYTLYETQSPGVTVGGSSYGMNARLMSNSNGIFGIVKDGNGRGSWVSP